jgi:hypothetical protein
MGAASQALHKGCIIIYYASYPHRNSRSDEGMKESGARKGKGEKEG